MFMSIEMMLNAANLAFVAFARYLNVIDGQVIVFFMMTVAAAEVVVGLAIIVSIFRSPRHDRRRRGERAEWLRRDGDPWLPGR